MEFIDMDATSIKRQTATACDDLRTQSVSMPDSDEVAGPGTSGVPPIPQKETRTSNKPDSNRA